MNAAAAVGPSPLAQVSAPPVAIGPEMTAALLLATAGAIALFWFTVKMVAGFREYRQVTNEREADEESKGTSDAEADDADDEGDEVDAEADDDEAAEVDDEAADAGHSG